MFALLCADDGEHLTVAYGYSRDATVANIKAMFANGAMVVYCKTIKNAGWLMYQPGRNGEQVSPSLGSMLDAYLAQHGHKTLAAA